METCNPDEYELTYKAVAPDRRIHQVIFDKKKCRSGYIHTKRYKEDDSYYAPYLVYKIGKKVGINVPETEMRAVLYINIDKIFYRDSFSESSIVYFNDNLWLGKYPLINNGYSHVAQEVVQGDYLMRNPGIAEERRKRMYGRVLRQMVDDYVNANLYFLTTRGSKPREEYSNNEIEEMKQELIDRALFGLRFGIHGNFDITLKDNRNAKLAPYYLANDNMFCLGVREEWINEQLSKTDEELETVLGGEYTPQYGLLPNVVAPTSIDVIKYIYEHYPKQAEKSYEKLSRFTEQDLEEELKECTCMSECHKKFALRAFRIRCQEFDQFHQEHIRTQSVEK